MWVVISRNDLGQLRGTEGEASSPRSPQTARRVVAHRAGPEPSKELAHADLPDSTPPPNLYFWEEYPAFRSTFTMHFTRKGDRDALEHLGRSMYDVALEMIAIWPRWAGTATQTEMRAAAADMRHLQGFLSMVGRERKDSSLNAEDAYLSTIADKMARQLGKLAEWIENELQEVR